MGFINSRDYLFFCRLIACVFLLCLPGRIVHAETETPPPGRTIEAVFVDTPPVIDGDLTDPCWQRIAFQGEFRRHDEPDRGGPARVDTAFAIAYDTENLYVGIVMHGDDPDALLRSVTRRDEDLDQDDNVCLYIDTFHDLRSAYFFQVNPIGTQRDLYSTAHGSSVDLGWDGVWDAGASLLADGWSAEFKIPFKILRLNWSESMTFGFDIVRFSKQREDVSEWCYTDLNQQSTLDPRQYGVITGLNRVDKPIMLQVIGSGVGSIIRTNRAAFPPPDETGWDSEEDLDGGLDIIWGISPTLTLTGTINPDFAQIEADPDQLNLNGEELYLEERRPFFRENSAIFQVPDGEHPFYSRRIVDIRQGMRLIGQVAGSDMAALAVNGEDGGGEDDLFGVWRSQTPLSTDFTLCTWLTAKHNLDDVTDFTNSHGEFYETVDDDTNILGGLDAYWRPGNWHLNLHLYRTWYSDAMRAWYTDTPTSEKEKIHFKMRYYGNQWQSITDYTDVGMGYHPELGFTNIARLGQRMLTQYIWAEKTFDEDHLLNSIDNTSHVLIAYNRDDTSHWSALGCNSYTGIEFDNHIRIGITGELYDDRSFYKFNEFSTDDAGQIIEPVARYYANTLGKGNNKIRTVSLDVSWTDGGFQGVGASYFAGFYYFSRVRQWNAWANWSWRSTLTVELDLDRLERYDPSDAYLDAYGTWTDWDVWIYRAKVMYYFNRDLHVRTIVSGYMDEDRRYNEHGVSALLAWEYLPGSHLYCVYESNWTPYDYEKDELLGLTDWVHGRETFYVKLSYMLSV